MVNSGNVGLLLDNIGEWLVVNGALGLLLCFYILKECKAFEARKFLDEYA